VKKLSDMGERKAIDLIFTLLSKGNTAVEIGDDCAVLDFGEEHLLVSTDMIHQDTHLPQGMTPFQIGWFVVAINLSDIAAKGGTPLGVVLSLGLPRESSDSFLKELMSGADACATRFNTSIIGGDTKENPSVTIAGTAVGTVNKQEFMPRRGARPGDVVAVTGSLGGAGAGLYALQHGLQDVISLKRLLEPIPCLQEGRALARLRCVTSCMDISDGLSSSLYQLRKLNSVGFEINGERIPIASELAKLQRNKDIDIYEYALHSGGDYELMLTLPSDCLAQATQALEEIGTQLTRIGGVTETKEITKIFNGKRTILSDRGYEHFKNHFSLEA
jgi:thiamine-monophosphate kinase